MYIEYPSLKQIWRQSRQTLLCQLWVYSIGAVVFGGISATIVYNTSVFLSGFFAQSTLFNSVQTNDVQALLQSGNINSTSLLDLLASMGPDSIDAQIALQEFTIKLYTEAVPIVVLAVLLVAIVWFIAMKYYLIAACKQTTSARATLFAIARYILPELLLSALVFLRSFTWVPLIGFLLTFIYTPRYTLAGIYLVKEHQGIFTSARLSFERTRGHWWYIVRSVYGITTYVSLLYMVFKIVLWLIPLSSLANIIVSSFVSQIGLAFCVIAMVKIGEVLMENKQIDMVQ